MVSSRKPSLQATRPKPRFSLSRGFFNFGTSGSLNGFESWGGYMRSVALVFAPGVFFSTLWTREATTIALKAMVANVDAPVSARAVAAK